ncbi:MAG: type II toxin-antitoxin system RelE/ParE family toxin [Rhodocyclaceae bacterium]|nr:type II toxin-antitoxin system RelE/ParE family toxin [Rhodocyclaceae bacterium]
MGRPGRVPGTRELVVTRFPYILPYRVREQAVEILRIFHTSRKWPQRFD